MASDELLRPGLVLSGALAFLGLIFIIAGLGALYAGEQAHGCGLLLTGGVLLPLALGAGGLVLLALNGG